MGDSTISHGVGYISQAENDRRMCALCNTSLGEEAVIAMNRLWHPDHFRCHAYDKPYCVQCFSKKYNPKCHGCGEILIDSCLIALDKHWHPRCFTCASCKQPLPNGEHYIIDDLPYDRDCHWEKRLEKRIRITQEAHTRIDH
ncbi:Paxillin [Dirofilaria immitis]|nr:Paxillin [Dirofilaria immitis]